MVELATVVEHLDHLLLPERYSEGELSNGLLVDAGKPVGSIGAAVNTSFASIREAGEAGAGLLLVHHPAWEATDGPLAAEKHRRLAEAGISLYAAHAALHCAPDIGSPTVLARQCGVVVNGQFGDYAGGSIGVHGASPATSLFDFTTSMEQATGLPVSFHRNRRDFGRVAVVCGSGATVELMIEAGRMGCDTFVTGEASMFAKLFAREAGLNLVLTSHYGSEAPGLKALAERVAADLDLPWTFCREDPDIL